MVFSLPGSRDSCPVSPWRIQRRSKWKPSQPRPGLSVSGIRATCSVLRWKSGVGKNGVLLAHAPEPVVSYGGRAGWKRRCSFRTRTGAKFLVWWKGGVENGGLGRCICMLLDQRHIARTRTGANSICTGWRMVGWVAVFACYWTSATLLAHVSEPIVFAWWKNGSEKKNGLRKDHVYFAHVSDFG